MTSQQPRIDFDDIRRVTTGAWIGVLSDLGIEVHLNRHAPCPGCGGTDRFRFDDLDGRGTFVCSQGGGDVLAGDGFALVRHVRGCGVAEAFEAVAEVIGGADLRTRSRHRNANPPAPPDSPRKRAYALELWLQANRNGTAVPAHGYVRRKGFQGAHGCGVVGSRLLVPIRAHGTGKVIAVQSITEDGDKRTYGGMTAEDGTPGYLLLGNDLDPACRLFVVEGWADAVAVVFLAYEGNAACAIAFGKGRLDKVAEQVAADLERRPLIIGDRP
ncbi:MAG: primase-helicase zinc-binding domain-containing protein [Roseibium album]|uniref:primase-helicase zinc-binding domain-containing protein n=1 Tax=Roseibium album TaxID=311410 RepID=UPI0032EC5A63